MGPKSFFSCTPAGRTGQGRTRALGPFLKDCTRKAKIHSTRQSGNFAKKRDVFPKANSSRLAISNSRGANTCSPAIEGDFDIARFRSNLFSMEWPPRSGRIQEFPEVDRAEWFAPTQASRKILKGAASSPKHAPAAIGRRHLTAPGSFHCQTITAHRRPIGRGLVHQSRAACQWRPTDAPTPMLPSNALLAGRTNAGTGSTVLQGDFR